MLPQVLVTKLLIVAVHFFQSAHFTAVAVDCPREAIGADITNQTSPILSSAGGYLFVNLHLRSRPNPFVTSNSSYYCHMMDDNVHQAPTIRLKQGDFLELTLHNELPPSSPDELLPPPDNCGSLVLTPTSTNLHYHGTHVSPTCHKDEALKTIVNSGENFQFSFQVPINQPPGLYWYHPHVYLTSITQVQGGATGVMIVEGIEHVQPAVAGLHEQIFVFRSEEVRSDTNSSAPHEGISLNYVPILFPDFATPTYRMKPGEKQLWRIANTCSMAILQLSLLYDGVAQGMIGVARDGVAMGVNQTAVLNTVGSLGTGATVWQLFPGSRIELIVTGPSASVSKSQLVTISFDTGPDGDSDPSYPLLNIIPDEAVVKSPDAIIPANPADAQTLQRVPKDLAQQAPAVTRILDFYQEPVNASDPNSDTIFYVTPRGQPRVAFPDQKWPNINVTQGVVEDWIINNPTEEEHIFHIHQMHFLVMERDSLTNPTPLLGTGLDQMWDVIDVPCCNHSVKIRVDFTGDVVGMFPYHCHLFEHQEAGMMSYLQVLPAPTTAPSATASSSSTDGGSISEDALIIIIVLGGVAGILLCALIAAGWRLAGRSLLVTDRAGPLEVDVV